MEPSSWVRPRSAGAASPHRSRSRSQQGAVHSLSVKAPRVTLTHRTPRALEASLV